MKEPPARGAAATTASSWVPKLPGNAASSATATRCTRCMMDSASRPSVATARKRLCWKPGAVSVKTSDSARSAAGEIRSLRL